MSDPTMCTVDVEPWNQSNVAPKAAPVVQIKSIYTRVVERIGIFVKPGKRADWVYDVMSGPSNAPSACEDCGIVAHLFMWQEWQWGAEEEHYLVRRNMDLCDVCCDAVRALPLGERWKQTKSKTATLRRCIALLERVGHLEGAAALRALERGGKGGA